MGIFSNKVVLITGATGSFGRAVVEKFLELDVKEIRIFSRDEKKQNDMRIALKDSRLKFFIGDVRDKDSIFQCLKYVDYVFHAAALKQVPSCEFYPMEALKTNVFGTDNVLSAANDAKVKKVVLLSTDKAVYPINAMGMSKAMAEKLLIAKSRMQTKNETIFCATRYGNVLASRGSVVPLFISQVKTGIPITITDPNMTRFLMSLSESVELVFYALEKGGQGDIFVQKSPAATVSILAKAICSLLGKEDYPIQTIGTRHGEKIYESLISREEMFYAQDEGKYYKLPCDNRDLNYAKFFSEGESKITNFEDYTSHSTTRLELEEVKNLLLQLNILNNL